MNVKEYLQQIEIMDSRIGNLLQQLESLRTLATRVTASYGGEKTSSSPNPQKMAVAVYRIVDLSESINEEIDKFIDLKTEIINMINKIDNADYINILYARYFKYETWEQIANELHYSYQWVCVLHGRALNVLANKLNSENSEKDIDIK